LTCKHGITKFVARHAFRLFAIVFDHSMMIAFAQALTEFLHALGALFPRGFWMMSLSVEIVLKCCRHQCSVALVQLSGAFPPFWVSQAKVLFATVEPLVVNLICFLDKMQMTLERFLNLAVQVAVFSSFAMPPRPAESTRVACSDSELRSAAFSI
jgi:hypothetical protein